MSTASQIDYREALSAVIAASWFSIDEVTYVYVSVNEVQQAEQHLMVLRDGNETTVVTSIENVPLPGTIQVNKEKWRLLNIRCGNPFYCVGFIASITNAFANAGIDIVIISSFSNDLVLVMQQDLEKAAAVLVSIGFTSKTS
jgi:hypothetical protein